MNLTVESALRKIGSQLDQQIFPRVKNGGIVTPSELAVPSTLGEEKYDAKSRKRRSATGPRQRAAGGEGSAGRSWTPGQTSPVVRASLQPHYEDELDAIRQAYPGAEVWRRQEEVWLLTESSLLNGFQRRALFLTGIFFDKVIVRSWGFWHSVAGSTWIGPRHTNFPDGSICAFDPTDGTWRVGDPIVELLDLYTLWAVRHLHLQVFGRWPGPQAAPHPYERISELRADEYCGCGASDKLYGECCRDADLRRDRVADAVSFLLYSGGVRNPPNAVVRFVRERVNPPRFNDVWPRS